MHLDRLLQSQGFGSRKSCRTLIESGAVTVNGTPCLNPQQDFDPTHLSFTVNDEPWQYREKVYVLLHKPPGYECSRNPQHHLSVFSLLPAPLIARGIQCVGRLDADTTGLLLLTDDGTWLHALTSPRRHVPKRYQVTTAEPVTEAMLQALRTGVLLHDESEALAALECVQTGPDQLIMTITQGKYHQVKRMLAAAGNRVTALHRAAIGSLGLGDLAQGQWRYLAAREYPLAAESAPP